MRVPQNALSSLNQSPLTSSNMKVATSLQVKLDLSKFKSSTRAQDLRRFFQTGPGQYGEGDLFLGITVPQVRGVAKKYKNLSLSEIEKLVNSKFHEERFCGLAILTSQFDASTNPDFRRKVYNFYVKKIKDGYVNNWDLIDVPGSHIAEHLLTVRNPLEVLIKYSKSS